MTGHSGCCLRVAAGGIGRVVLEEHLAAGSGRTATVVVVAVAAGLAGHFDESVAGSAAMAAVAAATRPVGRNTVSSEVSVVDRRWCTCTGSAAAAEGRAGLRGCCEMLNQTSARSVTNMSVVDAGSSCRPSTLVQSPALS